jgi:hypothetical protein
VTSSTVATSALAGIGPTPGAVVSSATHRIGRRQLCGAEPLAGGRDAAPWQLAVAGEDAALALALVGIESYRIHGGWPPGCALRR